MMKMIQKLLILSLVFTLAFSAPNEARDNNLSDGSPESAENGEDACKEVCIVS